MHIENSGGVGVGGNLGVIVVRVCELVFRNLPHSYTLPLHYQNKPIQMYRKFYHQKMKIFRQEFGYFFYISAQKIDCGYSLEPYAVLTSTHNLCF